ncbi:MAG TPA: PH domain-containing protein [Iamia sp.]
MPPRPDGAHQPLDPRVRRLWQTAALLATAPVVLVLLGTGAIVGAEVGALPGLGLVALAVVVVGLAVAVPVLRHRRWSWALTDEGLELAHGVVVRTESAIPAFRVQQVDIRQGPLERAFGLVTLQITTASSGSDGTLPGIDAAGADEVRRRILRRVAADDGV